MNRQKLKEVIKRIIREEVVSSTSEKFSLYPIINDYQLFEKEIATAEENSKKKLDQKLTKKFLNKKVAVIASKGYGQPKKEYTFVVKGVSVEWYYEEYIVVFKDEQKKDYFVDRKSKIKLYDEMGIGGGQMPANVMVPRPIMPATPSTKVSNITPQKGSGTQSLTERRK